jgi:hypothetical protein
MKQYRLYTKLTIVCEHFSHLIAGMTVRLGPSNDSPDLAPTMRQATQHLHVDRLLADGGYDSESNHALCREELGVRSTVIPINARRFSDQEPKSKYRRQMYRRFHNRIYGQRWQSESVFSRLKRHLGSALRARTHESRARECYWWVLTYNLMIL